MPPGLFVSDTPLSAQRYISQACEDDLLMYGDSFRGAGYTKSAEEAAQRYALMLGVIREARDPLTLLDFGCGLAHLLDFMQRETRYSHVRYTGLDLSPKYLEAAKARHADQTFLLLDVLQAEDRLPQFDYVIMNGVFNFRGALSEESMLSYWKQLTTTVFRHCRRGLAFNVMSQLVDWERDDLFHLSFDALAQHVAQPLSRHFVIRHDYGAYEYTTYVYRSPGAM
jgi:SAM-dependent methyltransferase